MFYKIGIVFFTFIISSFTLSQSSEKTIQGRIIIDVKDYTPEDIYIKNLRNSHTSITDIFGNFNIKASLGDTLQFYSTWYENRKIVLNKRFFEKENILIHLNLSFIALDEVKLRPMNLTGYLEKDVKLGKKEDKMTSLYEELGVNPDAKSRGNISDISAIEIFDVGRVYDFLSGDLRRKQNLYKYEDKETVLIAIKEYFGEDYFIKELHIPKEKIRDFINYSYETSNIPLLYKNNSYLEIMRILHMESSVYLKKFNPPFKITN